MFFILQYFGNRLNISISNNNKIICLKLFGNYNSWIIRCLFIINHSFVFFYYTEKKIMTNIVKKSEIFNSMQGRHKYWFYLIRFIFATAGRKRSESWLTQTSYSRFVHARIEQYILTFNCFRVLTIDSFMSVFIELLQNTIRPLLVLFSICECCLNPFVISFIQQWSSFSNTRL